MQIRTSVHDWWTEIWSIGEGRTRLYCGIARTDDGFAVDLFRGDTCIGSTPHDTRPQAERAAAALERRYLRRHVAA